MLGSRSDWILVAKGSGEEADSSGVAEGVGVDIVGVLCSGEVGLSWWTEFLASSEMAGSWNHPFIRTFNGSMGGGKMQINDTAQGKQNREISLLLLSAGRVTNAVAVHKRNPTLMNQT